MTHDNNIAVASLPPSERHRPSKRRILVLAAQPVWEKGGTEHAVRELADSLRTRGYAVEVLDLRTAGPPWLWKCVGSFDHRLAAQMSEFFLARAVRTRGGEEVAAIISHGDVGFLPLRRPRGVKLIHFYHGTYRGQAEAIRPFISQPGYLYLKYWNSMALERASGRGKLVLCNSNQTRAEVERFFRHRAMTVWYPLDLDRFRPIDRAEARHRLGLSASQRIGLFVGSASPVKNLPIVRGLIRRMPEVSWLVALRGPVPEDFLDHPRIRLFQDADGNQLPLLYNAADFSVCPSFYESFGYVIAESLACGTPVIASPTGAGGLLLEQPPLRSVHRFRSRFSRPVPRRRDRSAAGARGLPANGSRERPAGDRKNDGKNKLDKPLLRGGGVMSLSPPAGRMSTPWTGQRHGSTPEREPGR